MTTPLCDSDQLRDLGFFGVIQYLQSIASPQPSKPPRAHRLAPGLKLQHNPELRFACADLEGVHKQGEQRYQVQSSFLGLCGANAPIPDYLTQDLATLAEAQATVHDYLDLFHHRLYELLYFGVTEQDIPNQLTQDPQSVWKERIACLLGWDLRAQPLLHSLCLRTLFAIAPCLMHSPPSKEILQEALNRVLELHLGHCGEAPLLRIEDFQGEETPLHSAFHNALGVQNHRLGDTCVLGTMVKDPSSKICVVIQVRSPEHLHPLSAGGAIHQVLSTILRALLCTPLEVNFELLVNDQTQVNSRVDSAILGEGAKVGRPTLTMGVFATRP